MGTYKDFAVAGGSDKVSAGSRMIMRFSGRDDVDGIIMFYRDHCHHHVSVRKEELIESHASAGQFLLGFDQRGGIIASSAVYNYFVKGDRDRPSYQEVGSTLFGDNARGFGLYPFFIASQVIEAFINKPPFNGIIAAIYDSSPVGRDLLVPQVGWKTIDPTPDIVEVFENTRSPEHTNEGRLIWYGSKSQCLPKQARIVLDWIDKGKAFNNKTRAVMNIDFSQFPLAGELNAYVQEIANGQFRTDLESVEYSDKPLAQVGSELFKRMNRHPPSCTLSGT